MIRPGSSSVRALTSLPWRWASASSTPRASVGSIGRAISEVQSESRPNRVMNHGAPAAMTGRRRPEGSNRRSAARSMSDRWYGPRQGRVVGVQGGSVLDPLGLACCGVPVGQRPERPLDPLAAERDVDRPRRLDAVARRHGDRPGEPALVERHLTRALVGGQRATRWSAARTPSTQSKHSASPSTYTRCRPCGRGWPCLTEKRSAKSAATSTRTVAPISPAIELRSSISSHSTGASFRRRTTRSRRRSALVPVRRFHPATKRRSDLPQVPQRTRAQESRR